MQQTPSIFGTTTPQPAAVAEGDFFGSMAGRQPVAEGELFGVSAQPQAGGTAGGVFLVLPLNKNQKGLFGATTATSKSKPATGGLIGVTTFQPTGTTGGILFGWTTDSDDYRCSIDDDCWWRSFVSSTQPATTTGSPSQQRLHVNAFSVLVCLMHHERLLVRSSAGRPARVRCLAFAAVESRQPHCRLKV